MSTRQATSPTIALTSGRDEADGGAHYGGLHALAPMMVGLLISISAYAVVGGDSFVDTQAVLHVSLMAVMLVSAAIFAISLINPGDVGSVEFDRDSASVVLGRQGSFAVTFQRVSFRRIAGFEFRRTYDRDGYGTARAVMILKSSEVIELPQGLRQFDVDAMNSIVGLR